MRPVGKADDGARTQLASNPRRQPTASLAQAFFWGAYCVFGVEEARAARERDEGQPFTAVGVQVRRKCERVKLGLGRLVHALAPRRHARALVVRLHVHDARLLAVGALVATNGDGIVSNARERAGEGAREGRRGQEGADERAGGGGRESGKDGRRAGVRARAEPHLFGNAKGERVRDELEQTALRRLGRLHDAELPRTPHTPPPVPIAR